MDTLLDIISCPTCVTYILQNILASFTTFRQLHHKGNNNFFFSFCFLFFPLSLGGSEKGEPAFINIVLQFSNHWAVNFFFFYIIYWLHWLLNIFISILDWISFFSGFLYPSLLFWHLSVVTHNKANRYVDPLIQA